MFGEKPGRRNGGTGYEEYKAIFDSVASSVSMILRREGENQEPRLTRAVRDGFEPSDLFGPHTSVEALGAKATGDRDQDERGSEFVGYLERSQPPWFSSRFFHPSEAVRVAETGRN